MAKKTQVQKGALAQLAKVRKSKVGSKQGVSPVPSLKVCTCVGSCKGAKGLNKGWICALKQIEQLLPCS